MKKVGEIDLSWLRNVGPGVNEKDQMSLQVLDVVLRNASAINSPAVSIKLNKIHNKVVCHI